METVLIILVSTAPGLGPGIEVVLINAILEKRARQTLDWGHIYHWRGKDVNYCQGSTGSSRWLCPAAAFSELGCRHWSQWQVATRATSLLLWLTEYFQRGHLFPISAFIPPVSFGIWNEMFWALFSLATTCILHIGSDFIFWIFKLTLYIFMSMYMHIYMCMYPQLHM